MPALKHLHTYVRHKKKRHIYRCADPRCSHYTDVENLRGKEAHCKCGNTFVLSDKIDNKHFKRAELKCDVCLGLVQPAISVATQTVLDRILKQNLSVEIEPPSAIASAIEEDDLLELDKDDLIIEEDD